MSSLVDRHGHTFAAVVSRSLGLRAELDILMLRPSSPGDLVNKGDIDNRLKTLLDGLSAPAQPSQVPDGMRATSKEDPMPHRSSRSLSLLLAVALSLVLVSGVALAAGSPEKPPTPPTPSEPAPPPTPGVEAYNQGVRLMKKEKFPEAQAKFEEALAANAELAEAHNNLGYSLRKQGKEHYAEALEHYNQAIAMKPKLAH